jgi:hypothetical protein
MIMASNVTGPVAFARPVQAPAIARISPVVAGTLIVPIQPQPQLPSPDPRRKRLPEHPLMGTLSGHLLHSWPDGDGLQMWYLPAFATADDPDPTFEFAATQSAVDGAGNPFNNLRLTFRLKKVVPAEVTDFLQQKTNPAPILQEVPLNYSTPTLTLSYMDSHSGAPQTATLNGAVAVQPDGSLDLTFDNVLGVNVVILFENLRTGGTAVLSVSANYQAWLVGTGPEISPHPLIFVRPEIADTTGNMPRQGPEMRRPVVMMRPATVLSASALTNTEPAFTPAPLSRPPTTIASTTATIAYPIALGTKYAREAYLSKYTVTVGGATRPIVGIDDLRDYNVRQSEFRELHILGDVSQRYPSIARLFFGSLSRVIVAIPTRYVIQRNSDSCAASCQVLLDSSSGKEGAKFQFDFLLEPDISPVDLAQLAQQIDGHDDLKNCIVTTPSFLKQGGSSTLNTIFKSSATLAPGSTPHSFALSAELVDGGTDSHAIANANVLIRQLFMPHEPYLSGVIDLRIDDMLPDQIQVPLVLNFSATAGNDGLSGTIDEGSQSYQLSNHSAFDLHLKRYALGIGNNLDISGLDQAIKSGQTLPLPLPALHAGLNVLVDRELLFEGAPNMDAMSHYLDVRVQDVQSVQCLIGINAGAVDFTKRGIGALDALLSFTDLPQVAPVNLKLFPKDRVASAGIPIPIQAVLGRLAATIRFTINYADAAKASDHVTVPNDFLQEPLFVLLDSALGAP